MSVARSPGPVVLSEVGQPGGCIRFGSNRTAERGFIRDEVVSYADLAPLRGNLTEARELGTLRLEGLQEFPAGRERVLEDGESVHFRFNV